MTPITGKTVWRLTDQLFWTFSTPWKSFRHVFLFSLLGLLLALSIIYFQGISIDWFVLKLVIPITALIIPLIYVTSIALALMGFFHLTTDQKELFYTIDDDAIIIADIAGNAVTTPWTQVKAFHQRRPGICIDLAVYRPVGYQKGLSALLR